MTNANALLLSLLFFALVHPTLADDGYLPNGSMTQGQDYRPVGGRRPGKKARASHRPPATRRSSK